MAVEYYRSKGYTTLILKKLKENNLTRRSLERKLSNMKRKILFTLMYITIFICIVAVLYNIYDLYEINKYSKEINELIADDIEIEKKWLIDINDIPYDLSKAEYIVEIEQTYISFSPEIRVRKYKDLKGKYSYQFTVKTDLRDNAIVRDEFNSEISEKEYNELILKKEGNTIQKTRYQLLDNNKIIAIDIFHGDLNGLAYMEIEFKNLDEANVFITPDWVIKDVTGDINYKNGYLARYGIPYLD